MKKKCKCNNCSGGGWYVPPPPGDRYFIVQDAVITSCGGASLYVLEEFRTWLFGAYSPRARLLKGFWRRSAHTPGEWAWSDTQIPGSLFFTS